MPAANRRTDRPTRPGDGKVSPALPRLVVFFASAGLTGWVFAEVLFLGGMFAYRDASHFYYPLLEFTRSQWAAGRVPLWNPYGNLGSPLAANAAAAVFYPGMLIFALPIGFAWCYRLYVVGHVAMAAAGAYFVARRWRASRLAAGCCAVSYAFCGNVLIQHANVVFLVGAAWLPFALLAADRMLVGRSLRAALGLGAVLAMMVLGGDPQMAYNAGLMAALYAVVMGRRRGAAGAGGDAGGGANCPRPPAARRPFPASGRGGRRLVLLAVAGVTGVVLSAVQVLPSMEFAARSDRAAGDVPRSLYEVPGRLGGTADGLLCREMEPGEHRQSVYHFSVGPWRLLEYVWPNVSGRQYPVHRRWLDIVPGEARVWTPSLYMGLLPLVLALASVRLRRGPRRDRWLSWTAVLAVVASLGWFGLGWLVHEAVLATGGNPKGVPFGPPVGGLYWLMTVLLPGYVQFRYPAKLLVVAAMALSLLAARGWDRAFAGRLPRLAPALAWLAGLSLVGAIGAMIVRPFWDGWMLRVDLDLLFGPLDRAAAWGDLLGGFLQTAVLAAVFWWLLRRVAGGSRWAAGVALVLVAVDLGVANRWMVATAPAELWTEPSHAAVAIRGDYANRGGTGQPRVYRRPLWLPPEWCGKSSPDRLAEEVRWDRDTLWPNYQVTAGLPMCEASGTMALADYRALLGMSRQWPGERGEGQAGSPLDWLQWELSTCDYGKVRAEAGLVREDQWTVLPSRWFLDCVGAQYLMLRADETPPGDAAIPVDGAPEDCSLWWNPRALDRAWTESEGRFERGPARVSRDGPLRVEIEATMPAAGRVVLADQFYPGWHLEVETEGQGSRAVPIECAHRVMRAAELPAGRHRLVYTYRPSWLPWGVSITLLGWLGLLAVGVRSWVVSRRTKVGDGK